MSFSDQIRRCAINEVLNSFTASNNSSSRQFQKIQTTHQVRRAALAPPSAWRTGSFTSITSSLGRSTTADGAEVAVRGSVRRACLRETARAPSPATVLLRATLVQTHCTNRVPTTLRCQQPVRIKLCFLPLLKYVFTKMEVSLSTGIVIRALYQKPCYGPEDHF